MTEDRLIDKLRKVLALTTSPIEGEAQAAAEHLQRLLTAHNLSIADLEKRGTAAKPGVRQDAHDLGKAAFTWKLNLAEVIAEHYFCVSLVDRRLKTVAFVGRPDNVESLQMLYAWLIDQIKRISAEERRNHYVRTNEHIDPLRWQVNFGLGVVQRLRDRLHAIKEAQNSDPNTTALVVHHISEINDWMEATYGYRKDGRPTKQLLKWRADYDANEQRLAELKVTDIEAFYEECPWERPERVAQREKERIEAEKKEARLAKRRTGRSYTYRERKVDDVKENQAYDARQAGKRRADDVNLQPFIEGRSDKGEVKE